MRIRIPYPTSWAKKQTSRIKWHSDDKFDEDTSVIRTFTIFGISFFKRINIIDVKHDTEKIDKIKKSAGF